jgi:hypothetical protein
MDGNSRGVERLEGVAEHHAQHGARPAGRRPGGQIDIGTVVAVEDDARDGLPGVVHGEQRAVWRNGALLELLHDPGAAGTIEAVVHDPHKMPPMLVV